jgi:hypothetical protein
MIRRLGIVIALAICGAVALGMSARAHSFYPWECCSGIDCAELSADRVSISAGGYVIDGKFTVPYSETRNSPDGLYHACFPAPDYLKCFWAPPPGS